MLELKLIHLQYERLAVAESYWGLQWPGQWANSKKNTIGMTGVSCLTKTNCSKSERERSATLNRCKLCPKALPEGCSTKLLAADLDFVGCGVRLSVLGSVSAALFSWGNCRDHRGESWGEWGWGRFFCECVIRVDDDSNDQRNKFHVPTLDFLTMIMRWWLLGLSTQKYCIFDIYVYTRKWEEEEENMMGLNQINQRWSSEGRCIIATRRSPPRQLTLWVFTFKERLLYFLFKSALRNLQV